MPIQVAGRQYPVWTEPVVAGFADLTDAIAVALAEVPVGAIVVGGYVNVKVVWDSTTNVVDVGDGDDPNRYTASAVDLKALGYTALTITGYEYTAPDTVDATQAETGAAPTQGSAEIAFAYIVKGRDNEVQG